MSNQEKNPTKGWTKEKCLVAVTKCATKEQIEEKYPEAAKAIKDNKWFYMYGEKHLGTDIGDTTNSENPPLTQGPPPSNSETENNTNSGDLATDTPPPITPEKPKSPLNLAAQNLKTATPVKATMDNTPRVSRKAKTYKLIKYAPLSFTLNVGRSMNLRVFDSGSQTERAIRHCPNSRTIFVDEQNPNVAVVEPIVFIKGFFFADEKKGYTQDFLDIHPKLGQVFEEVDAEMDARSVVDLEDSIIDIKSAIRDRMREEGGIEEVRAIVSVLNADVVGAAKMTPSEIRFSAYQCVDSNPKRFLNDRGEISIFDDPVIKRTAIAQHAFIAGTIQVSPNGRQVVWADTKKPICAVPMGLNYLQVFSEFLSSDEGYHVAQELTKR